MKKYLLILSIFTLFCIGDVTLMNQKVIIKKRVPSKMS